MVSVGMSDDADILSDDPAVLKAMIAALQTENARMSATLQAHEQLVQALRLRIDGRGARLTFKGRARYEAGIKVREKRFSLFDVYSADEAFVTGTFAGVTPVREVDGRTMEEVGGPMAKRITGLYQDLVARSLTPIK